LLAFAKDAADVKSQSIVVEKRWHKTIIGSNGATLKT